MAGASSPPSASPPPPSGPALPAGWSDNGRGLVLVDRHLEKNAGTTFRELLHLNEKLGHCVFWGYQQRSPAWRRAMAALSNLTADSVPPRLCIEAHTEIDHGVAWLTRLEQLVGLKALYARRRVEMDVVLVLRLREPLAQYVSFYLWTVAERQAHNPQKFGRSFVEWAQAVPNLQSELLLSSANAQHASFAPLDHPNIREWRARWAKPASRAKRTKLVWATLRKFDVVGTAERFDEFALALGRRLNWSISAVALPLRHNWQIPGSEGARCTSTPSLQWRCREHGGESEMRRVHDRVCPNRTACAELIRRVAPLDHALYAHATAALDAAASGARFAEQLAELRATRNHMKRQRCAWRPLTPAARGGREAERFGRRGIFAHAPNFTDNARGVCARGDPAVMREVWAEHLMGGRAPPPKRFHDLRPVAQPRMVSARARPRTPTVLLRAHGARRRHGDHAANRTAKRSARAGNSSAPPALRPRTASASAFASALALGVL